MNDPSPEQRVIAPPSELAAAFVARATQDGVKADRDALGAALTHLVQQARSQWPQLELPPTAFVEHLAERIPQVEDVVQLLAGLFASDLYLAMAALTGQRFAIAEIHRRLAPPSLLAMQLRLERSLLEDLGQRLSEAVLVARPGRPAQLTNYSGRGPLNRWLQAAALHAAMNMRRTLRDVPEGLRLGDEATQLADPELGFIREAYRDDFSAAFREALLALTPRDRNVLRLHLSHRLNIERIGTCYGVHRTTVARWIAHAREQLLVHTRTELARRLRLSGSEVDSMVRLLRSQLSESIVRCLGTTEG